MKGGTQNITCRSPLLPLPFKPGYQYFTWPRIWSLKPRKKINHLPLEAKV